MLCAGETHSDNMFQNPVDVVLADPQILRDGDTYYMYGTNESDYGYRGYKSKDLVNWESVGWVFKKTPQTWAQVHMWAPEVIKYKGFYYLAFSAANDLVSKTKRLCLARSDSPAGPFIEYAAPIHDTGVAMIDAHIYVDDDEKAYLYYSLDCSESKISQLHVVRLNEDLTGTIGESVLCTEPSQAWEGKIWNEGAFVTKHKGVYYLMYSANCFVDSYYQVGYATSKSPMGPWVKYEKNPILRRTARVSGPGHHCLTTSPDGSEMFIVYHRHLDWIMGDSVREIAIDRIVFEPNRNGPDIMKVLGPTHKPTPLPSGAKPFALGASDDFNSGKLDRNRWIVINEYEDLWRFDEGKLEITTQNGDVYRDRFDAKNIFLQYAPKGDYQATLKLSFNPVKNYDQAFITLWQDSQNYVRLAKVYSDKLTTEFAREHDGWFHKLKDITLGYDIKFMRITKKGDQFTFSVSGDGKKWQVIGRQHCDYYHAKIGFGAISPVSGEPQKASFDFFEIEKK